MSAATERPGKALRRDSTSRPGYLRLIDRNDLVAALDRAAASKVAIITAPAGSGKSSLRRAWADRPGQQHQLAIVQAQRDKQDAADYLIAEMLECQPEDVRNLLLRTSLLQRVNGELADLLIGRPGSERILFDLEDANPFVAPSTPNGPGSGITTCSPISCGWKCAESCRMKCMGCIGEPPTGSPIMGGSWRPSRGAL